jgi:hypothetical protein
MTDRERFVNCVLGKPVDRVPFWLFWGPWGRTWKRWEREGKPQEVANRIMNEMERGVTQWPGVGMYSGQERKILFCVVSRAEVAQLKAIIQQADPAAFAVIGQAHEALGEGFRPLGT